jgi:hypothetical protein
MPFRESALDSVKEVIDQFTNLTQAMNFHLQLVALYNDMNDVDAQEPWHNVSRPTLKLK